MASQSNEGSKVNIDSLGIEQLSQVKKQIEEEVEHLGSSFAQLHAAQAKFRECLRCVQTRTLSSGEPQSVLVPLTNSLYVRGEIPQSDQVMVDIGTGYLVQKVRADDAKVFYQSKVEGLAKTLQEIEAVLQEKTNNIRSIDDVIRKKMTTATPQEG
ncbi:related to prefoldin subunit 5 [Cephalotrichum gorgonifer]|uniref:Related to prefoldin subunit 5 n=1 Tax=Cephalotrichum gorgonifer TaxID=2041049 RepID=A0AAE8N0Q5_9PEZI|nr:related to prefoldin subunit 5 [Cephalotrichum gorgonifer]